MKIRAAIAVGVMGVMLMAPLTGRAQQTLPAAVVGSAAEALRVELERLKQEFEQVRQQYGDRLVAIEARIAAIEGKPAPVAAQPTPEAQVPEVAVPPGAAGAGGPTGALPVYGNASALSKIFNPDIAIIGNLVGAAGRNKVDPIPALALQEAELSLQAIVDPYARADFFLAFGPEGAEVEEGFVTFANLPGSFLVKAGKMKAQFGKVNTQHSHTLSWADRPLVVANLLGGEEGISDGGISVSRLLLNPYFFLEATGEVFRGETGPFTAPTRGDLTYVGRLRGYRDVTESTNLDVGASVAVGHAGEDPEDRARLVGVDATFRYRPLRRAIYRRLLARTELVWSRHEHAHDDLRASAFGMYLSTDYQFARRWFAGARWDYSERALDPSIRDKGASLVLTFWPSEFSQVRGQYRRINYGRGAVANEVLFQALFSIGAHGAHKF